MTARMAQVVVIVALLALSFVITCLLAYFGSSEMMRHGYGVMLLGLITVVLYNRCGIRMERYLLQSRLVSKKG